MFIGLIADVHSNIVALEAVLLEMDNLGIEKILHAGDLVGYNPYPNETIELFRKRKIISIRGNHERALLSGDMSDLNWHAACALRWTSNTISRENLDYISKIKDTEVISLGDTEIFLVHGSPNDPDEYVYPEDVEPGLLTMTSSDILVLGHTHIQFKKQFNEGIIVNPGSVGQPRDKDPASAFAILDTDTKRIELERTEYDVEKVIEDMRKTYLPDEIALRLRDGV
ncbi:MAG: metallophosphoesterase family protein [Candidatus Methanoperedens sp.]